MVIPFAEWAPDRSDFDPSVTDTATNVVPRPTSYGPFPSITQAASAALASTPRGALMARTAAGVYQIFAGTATKLYKFNTTTRAWDDVSKPATTYTVPSEGAWSMVQFGDLVIATNGSDVPQAYNLASPTTFDNLAGSPPTGTQAAVVGDFLTLGNTSTYGTRSVAWSGLNDATTWTPPTKLSDYQEFPEGGEVLGIAGFETGAVVFQDNMIREMSLAISSGYTFTFQKTDETRTIAAPRSIVRAGQAIYFLTLEGFYRYGRPSQPIGNERVDRFFQTDADIDQIWQVQGANDPINKHVYWRYKSNSSTSTTLTDRVLIYNYALDKWSVANVSLGWLFPATTPGATLEGLDALGYTLDTLPTSLDSRDFSGGTPLIAGFDSTGYLGFFSGAPLEATIQTGDIAVLSPRRAFVNGFRPICDAPSISGRVAVKDSHQDSLTWGTSASVLRTGVIPARANGRLHRFEVTIPAGTVWNHAHGVDIQPTDGGDQ